MRPPAGLHLEWVVQVGILALRPSGEHRSQVGWEEEGTPSLRLAHVNVLVRQDLRRRVGGDQHEVAEGDGTVAAPSQEQAGKAATRSTQEDGTLDPRRGEGSQRREQPEGGGGGGPQVATDGGKRAARTRHDIFLRRNVSHHPRWRLTRAPWLTGDALQPCFSMSRPEDRDPMELDGASLPAGRTPGEATAAGQGPPQRVESDRWRHVLCLLRDLWERLLQDLQEGRGGVREALVPVVNVVDLAHEPHVGAMEGPQ